MEVKYIITQLFIMTSVIISSLNSDTAYSLVHRVIMDLKEILLPLIWFKGCLNHIFNIRSVS